MQKCVRFKFVKVFKSVPHWENNAHFYSTSSGSHKVCIHFFKLYLSHKKYIMYLFCAVISYNLYFNFVSRVVS